MLVIFCQEVPRLQPYYFGQKWLKIEIHSLSNLQIQKSINVNFESFLAKQYQGYSLTILAKHGSKLKFHSLFNLQIQKSINFNFGHFLPRSTKAIALLFQRKMTQVSSLDSNLQCKINQVITFESCLAKYQGYSLGTFSQKWLKIEIHSLFNLQIQKSINFNF